MGGKSEDQYSEQETVRRAGAALKRMFSTPHKLHKPLGKKAKAAAKRASSAKR
jgi:hypothetical protein